MERLNILSSHPHASKLPFLWTRLPLRWMFGPRGTWNNCICIITPTYWIVSPYRALYCTHKALVRLPYGASHIHSGLWQTVGWASMSGVSIPHGHIHIPTEHWPGIMYDFSAPIMPLSVRIWQLGIAIGHETADIDALPNGTQNTHK